MPRLEMAMQTPTFSVSDRFPVFDLGRFEKSGALEKRRLAPKSTAGAFVINIGDLMARWTNDRWVSTMHRVVNPTVKEGPPAEAGGRDRRQSMAFFHQPNWNAEIKVLDVCLASGEAPKYEPVRSGPYLMAKFRATTR
ncbi:MAG: hypothetical protein E5W82_00280 [Mesorhizobium sp.]|nr:MAG: hypothetical protein E5W82_00280 [Mesorhizobium sp.]